MFLFNTITTALLLCSSAFAAPKSATEIYTAFKDDMMSGKSPVVIVTKACPHHPSRYMVAFMEYVVDTFYVPDPVLKKYLSRKPYKKLEKLSMQSGWTNFMVTLKKSPWFQRFFCETVMYRNMSIDQKIVRLAEAFELLAISHKQVHKFNDTMTNTWGAHDQSDTFLNLIKQAYSINDAHFVAIDSVHKQASSSFDTFGEVAGAANELVSTVSAGKVKLLEACKALIWVDAYNRGYTSATKAQIQDKVRDFFLSNSFAKRCCGYDLQQLFKKDQKRAEEDDRKSEKKKKKKDKKRPSDRV